MESIKEAGGSCRMDLGGLLHIRTMQGEVGQLDEQGGGKVRAGQQFGLCPVPVVRNFKGRGFESL